MHSLRKDLRDLVDYDSATGILTLAGFFSFTLPAPGQTIKALASRISSATYAATITPNGDTTDIVNVAALTGDIIIVNPLGTPLDGQKLTFRFEQDGTGSRALSWGTAFAFGTDVTAALIPTTASAKWRMIFQYYSVNSKWEAVGIARGF